MSNEPVKSHLRQLALLLAVLLTLWFGASVRADGGPIQVASSSVASEFPEGIRFKVGASGEVDITSIAVRLRIGQQTRGVYDYLAFQKGRLVDSELFWRTNTAARYIPPGTILTYNFEIEDAEGRRLITEQQRFIYQDARFHWEEVSQGPVAVAYHGPVKQRAELVLDTITKTLQNMGPLLGADIAAPIRVTMYNNVKEMLEALPPGSTTIRRELITEGQAFSDVGTLLVLGGGSLAAGTASHEVTHILTHRAGDSVFRSVPSWLDEGLSEYANVDPGFSYDVALGFAVANGRLLPITTMRVLPADPEDVIIFYGEASSIVRYMVNRFGAERMNELLAKLKAGKSVDNALLEVYGLDSLALENLWRQTIGGPVYTPPQPGEARPTPLPLPALLPYSLTPQPRSATLGEASITPTPQPTTVPAPPPETVPSPAPQLPAPTVEPKEAQREGGACSAPRGGAGVVDASGVALVVGLLGLGLRRRFRV